jgi:hypothetical protein
MSILLEKQCKINKHELQRIYLRMATNLENKHELQRIRNKWQRINKKYTNCNECQTPRTRDENGSGRPETNLFWFRANGNE